jgi:hypothetical protein
LPPALRSAQSLSYYPARLGNPVLLTVNDEMMQVDVFPPHCYL